MFEYIAWALAIGLVGGLFPVLRAARLPIVEALSSMLQPACPAQTPLGNCALFAHQTTHQPDSLLVKASDEQNRTPEQRTILQVSVDGPSKFKVR